MDITMFAYNKVKSPVPGTSFLQFHMFVSNHENMTSNFCYTFIVHNYKKNVRNILNSVVL